MTVENIATTANFKKSPDIYRYLKFTRFVFEGKWKLGFWHYLHKTR